MHLCETLRTQLDALSARTAELRAMAQKAEGAANAEELRQLQMGAREAQAKMTLSREHLERVKLNFQEELLKVLGGTRKDWGAERDAEGWVHRIDRRSNDIVYLPHPTEDLSGLERCTEITLRRTNVTQPTLPAGVREVDFYSCANLDARIDLSAYTELDDVNLGESNVVCPTLPAGVQRVYFGHCENIDARLDLSMYEALRLVRFSNSSVVHPTLPAGIQKAEFGHCENIDARLDLSMYEELQEASFLDSSAKQIILSSAQASRMQLGDLSIFVEEDVDITITN